MTEPQLSAEMEKRFDKEFGYLSVAIDYYVENAYPLRKESGMKHLRDIKQFLATALEEQRLRYIEQVEEMINTKYPLNRFTDSYTRVMSRGKQMPTAVVPLSSDDKEAVSFLEFILNQLKGSDE